MGEKGDTDRGLLPLTDQQFRHRRKLHNGFKVLTMSQFATPRTHFHSGTALPIEASARTPSSKPCFRDTVSVTNDAVS